MKFFLSLLTLSVVVARLDFIPSKIDPIESPDVYFFGDCDLSNSGNIFRGMALAAQNNKTDLTSDCYLHADMVLELNQKFWSSVGDNIVYFFARNETDLPEDLRQLKQEGMTPWFFPLQWYSLLSVEFSDTLIACQYKTVSKQLALKITESASGLADFVMMIIFAPFGYFGKYNSFFRSSLYDALEPVILSIWSPDENPLTCLQVGYSLGQVLPAILNYNSPSQVFFQSVDTYKLFANPQTVSFDVLKKPESSSEGSAPSDSSA